MGFVDGSAVLIDAMPARMVPNSRPSLGDKTTDVRKVGMSNATNVSAMPFF
jgi:hypothetical protein